MLISLNFTKFTWNALRALIIFTIISVTYISFIPNANAQTALTDNQRRAYLNYYAPVIMKRGNGDSGDRGRDWITNFDYDRDGNYSNNARNYRDNISAYITNAQLNQNIPKFEKWKIRPTLYTFLIEYQVGTRKDLVLQYHIYNATTESRFGSDKIHDWERVEIRIKGASGTPGTFEAVDFIVLTNHSRHIVREGTDRDVNFMSTATGKHVLVWQAEWSGRKGAAHGNELRFVQNSYAQIASERTLNKDAEVDVTSKDHDKCVHYVYVPDGSSNAVTTWGAQSITSNNAHTLYSGYDNENTAKWSGVERITYELQDIADISPSHWRNNKWQNRWKDDTTIKIRIVTPMILEQAEFKVPTNGIQDFFVETDDQENLDSRKGYFDKNWFFGTYTMYDKACNASFSCSDGEAFQDLSFDGRTFDNNFRTRDQANNDNNFSHGINWYQHDYFAHTGKRLESIVSKEDGVWLTGDWYKASKGGFDGRWIQLFDDNLEAQVDTPLSVSLSAPNINCVGSARARVSISGSSPQYTVTWKRGSSVISTQTVSSSSTKTLYSSGTYSVRVVSSSNKSWTKTFSISNGCSGPWY